MLLIPLAFISGLVFGLGVLLARLADPARILNGFDFIAQSTGKWDTSLALASMAAALIAAAGFRFLTRAGRPLIADSYEAQPRRGNDMALIAGSVICGIGWGMVGYSPATAIASLLVGRVETGIFVLAMLGGIALYRLLRSGAS